MELVLLKRGSGEGELVIWLSIIGLIALMFFTKWAINKLTPIVRKTWTRVRSRILSII